MPPLDSERITLRPFQDSDQKAAKALILAGLEEHWGTLDLSLNADLNDIAASYASGVFLVAYCGKRIVGTGAFLPLMVLGDDPAEGASQSERLAPCDTAQIVRMSVAADMRRLGIGRRILVALCDEARARGIGRLILETTSTWREVIAFYESFGFRVTHEDSGDTYFALEL